MQGKHMRIRFESYDTAGLKKCTHFTNGVAINQSKNDNYLHKPPCSEQTHDNIMTNTLKILTVAFAFWNIK